MQHIDLALRRIRWWILSSAVLFVLVGSAVLFLVPVDEKVRASGTAVAEEETWLYAPEDGFLQTISAPIGSAVKAGAVILVLDSHELDNQRESMLAELKEAEAAAQLKQSQLERIAKLPLPKEFWHAQTELVSAEQKARHAATERERYRQLFEAKLTSASEFDTRKLADELAQDDLATARDHVRVINAGLEQSITKEALADVNAALAHVERLKIELHVCEREIARRSLRSPVDGNVTLLLKWRVGERVAKGEELVHVSRGAVRRARLWVGEPQIHRLRVGQPVRLSTPVFNALRYGYLYGHTEEVALEPEPRPTDEPGHEARYQVKVRIDQTPLPLVLGTSLDAEIILRRVPIWRLLLPAQVEPHASTTAPRPALP